MSIQGRAVKKAVLPAVVTVTAAWWAAFLIYELVMYPGWFISNIGVLLAHAGKTMLMLAYGIVAGAAMVLFVAHMERRGKLEALAKDAHRNLTTSMGPVPIVHPAPKHSAAIPALPGYGVPGARIGEWLAAARRSTPEHARLLESLLKILNHDPRLPATHVPGGHGGKTLLEHSLLVTQVMLEMAPSWSYDGLRNKKGDVVVGLRNPNYVFVAGDPIVPITALAHDIGKIETYIKDSAGQVKGIRRDHDIVGSRMLARMPEFWDIPKDDREAILLAVAHYHHPQDLPMHEDGRAIDDRTIALMELLIKADKAAGKVESETLYPNTMGVDAEEADSSAVRLVDDEVLYNAFLAVIHESGRINGKDKAVRVGQKHGGLVYFAEVSLRVALIRYLGLSSTPVLGDGRSALTVQLMEMLSSRGLLVQEAEGKTYSYKRAMFRIAFFNSKTGKHLADWPAVLIMNPGTDLPKIAAMADHPSRVEIVRPVWGEVSAKDKASKASRAAGGLVPAVDLGMEEAGAATDEKPEVDPSDATDTDAAWREGEDPVPLPQETPASAARLADAEDEDDLIGALMEVDPLGAEDGDKDTVTPDKTGRDEDRAPENEDVDAFNRVVKKLGSNKPLKGLDKGHIERLGDRLQSGVDAALANLEKKAAGSGRPYSPAMLLVEKAKLAELLGTGALTLYATPKGGLLALEEVVAARGRFGWDAAVEAAEAGEQEVFGVVRSGGRVFLRFADFQKAERGCDE